MTNDIAPQQQSSTELDHQRLTSLINSMNDGVIATDTKGKIIVYNGAALDILDLNTSITDISLGKVLKLIDKNNEPIDVKELLLQAKKPLSSREYRLPYPDGSTINLFLSIAPVRQGYGHEGMHGYVLLLRNITREKSLEEERDEFISVTSHELRTPIAIAEGNISNALFMVNKNGHIKDIRAALEQAHNQVNFLSGLINDLSMLSRAERGKLHVEVEAINASELVAELVEDYRPDAEAKRLEIKTDIDPSLELLKSSKLYVREILQNFITNSIKYTSKGCLTVSAYRKSDGVLFEVSDTGIGISKTDQEKVFDKFFRSEDYRTKASGGTGLGLYVTMKLARLIRAEVSLHSELNKGSTFSIVVPNLQ